MTSLFVLLFLLSIVGLIVGLIRPTLFRMSRKRVSAIFGIAIVLFFIGIAVVTPSTPPSTANTAIATTTTLQTSPTRSQTVSKVASAPVSTAPTLEQKISGYAVQTYGDGITLDNVTKNSDKGLTVTLDVTNIVGSATFQLKTAALASRIFQDAFGYNPSAPNVSVVYEGAKVDQYGNTSNGQLMGYYMTAPVFAKFNWSNFDYSTLCDVLRQAGSLDPESWDFADGCIVFASNLR